MEEAWRDTNIAIERAHRIGRFSKSRTRPIVVKFANYKHKNNVFKVNGIRPMAPVLNTGPLKGI